MKKRLLSIALGLALSLSMFLGLSANAANIQDRDSSWAWAFNIVDAMVDVGIMDVDQNGNFHPKANTTRADFILYMWRTFGNPEAEYYAPSFHDVGWDSGYLECVEWCAQAGITNGVGNGNFGPYMPLTREMAFTFLYRAMVFLDVAPTYYEGHEFEVQISEFKDYLQVHDWAADSIQLMLDAGIVRGSNGYLLPRQNLNNVQTAALLYQYLEYMDENLNG